VIAHERTKSSSSFLHGFIMMPLVRENRFSYYFTDFLPAALSTLDNAFKASCLHLHECVMFM